VIVAPSELVDLVAFDFLRRENAQRAHRRQLRDQLAVRRGDQHAQGRGVDRDVQDALLGLRRRPVAPQDDLRSVVQDGDLHGATVARICDARLGAALCYTALPEARARLAAMRCYLVGLVALVSACFHPTFDMPRCGLGGECPSGRMCNADMVCAVTGGGDAGSDANMPDAAQCFGSFLNVCLPALPTTAVTVGLVDPDLDIDTGTSTMCDTHTSEYCVIAGTSFSVALGRKIRGHGTRPLILVSTTSAGFELTGDVDVSSSHDGTIVGAGALSATVCLSLASPPSPATGTSGGFGGSFGGRGGDGEQVDGNRGVAAAATTFPATPRGGCPGGAGGSGGVGGNGGGAVMIIGAAIRIEGKINASGAGGRGGPASRSGGGGGGSGGMIVIDSASITGSGSLFANGGGGGQGGTPGAGNGGDDGKESTGPLDSAAGGKSLAIGKDGGHGGDGSSGSAKSGGSGTQAQNQGGGGAGGGGAGFVRATGATGVTIAPPSMAQ